MSASKLHARVGRQHVVFLTDFVEAIPPCKQLVAVNPNGQTAPKHHPVKPDGFGWFVDARHSRFTVCGRSGRRKVLVRVVHREERRQIYTGVVREESIRDSLSSFSAA